MSYVVADLHGQPFKFAMVADRRIWGRRSESPGGMARLSAGRASEESKIVGIGERSHHSSKAVQESNGEWDGVESR